jgi:predicted phage terminase large subunit-like protein
MKTYGADQAAAIANLAAQELSRRSLIDFARRLYPGWMNAPHLDLVAGLLERVERGELKRLIVNLPPRHGKSLLCSSIFPAWFLGRHPGRNVIMATHSAELSERNSRGARALVQDNLWPFDSRLSGDSSSASRWNLDKGGGVYACGVGGSVTGRGADILICDDLLHDSGEGDRESAWRWFCEIAIPRLEPNAAIVAIGTRFAEDDVFGHLFASPDAAQWTVVKLPAISDSDGDLLHRPIGSALWPERVDVAELEARRREMGSRSFSSQFLQDPLPATGSTIRASWIQRFDYDKPPSFDKVIAAVDTASGTAISNDWSVIAKIGCSKNAYYIIDVWRQRVEFPQLIKRIAALNEETPRPSTVYIEAASSGIQIVQTLKQSTRLPIVGVPPKGSKESRVEATTGLWESGRVYLPREASWLNDTEKCLLSFPNGVFDDVTDAVTLGLSSLSVARKSWWFTFGGNGPQEYYFGEDDHSPEIEEAIPTMGSVGSALNRIGF